MSPNRHLLKMLCHDDIGQDSCADGLNTRCAPHNMRFLPECKATEMKAWQVAVLKGIWRVPAFLRMEITALCCMCCEVLQYFSMRFASSLVVLPNLTVR